MVVCWPSTARAVGPTVMGQLAQPTGSLLAALLF